MDPCPCCALKCACGVVSWNADAYFLKCAVPINLRNEKKPIS